MKRLLIVALAAIAAWRVVAADSADAKRLGGGRSLGAQRQVTPPPSRAATPRPRNPAAPAQALPPTAAPRHVGAGRAGWARSPASPRASASPRCSRTSACPKASRASCMLVLLVVGGIFLMRMFLGAARRRARADAIRGRGRCARRRRRRYRAAQCARRFEPTLGGARRRRQHHRPADFPPGFDPAPFAEQAKLQFRKLQAAYDAGDRKALADVMTPEMFAEIDKEIAERGHAHADRSRRARRRRCST